MAEPTDAGARDGLVVEGQRFAIVPEWVIDADVGDCAFRLYAVLLRYGQTSGARMPSRATLARRLRKRSVDTVDRAMKELVALGAVRVERRRDGRQNLTNLYHVRTTDPGRTDAATSDVVGPGRSVAARTGPARAATAGRADAAAPAAVVRPDPEHVTEKKPPPPENPADDFDALAIECRKLRRALKLPAGLWTAPALRAAHQRAAVERGYDGQLWKAALLLVAADPATRSPMRVAEAGPWWDDVAPAPAAASVPPAAELMELEARLDAVDGERVRLQRRARAALEAEGAALTRTSVLVRAVALMDAS